MSLFYRFPHTTWGNWWVRAAFRPDLPWMERNQLEHQKLKATHSKIKILMNFYLSNIQTHLDQARGLPDTLSSTLGLPLKTG